MVQTFTRPEQAVFTPVTTDQAQAGLKQRLASALEMARAMTANAGHDAIAARVAWDIVEELWTASARRCHHARLTNFERYCRDYPDAPESRIYDV
jgi:hypothetical protein